MPGGAVNLLRGTAIDCLVVDAGDSRLADVRSRAGKRSSPGGPLRASGEHLRGERRMARRQGGAAARAGLKPGLRPGVPWVDSNGWAIQLARARHPQTQVWVNYPPAPPVPLWRRTIDAIAIHAAYGGRWIVSLDSRLAAAMAAHKAEADKPWNRVRQTAAFFARHQAWCEYVPFAVVGVISDFSGANEFFSQELLNLLARAGRRFCRILPKQGPSLWTAFARFSMRMPSHRRPPLRKQILEFVEAGGMLVTHQWPAPSQGALPAPVDSFSVYAVGKGKSPSLKIRRADYVWANDSVVLVSHRYDLVRLWNGGATVPTIRSHRTGDRRWCACCFTGTVAQDAATVRVAGRYACRPAPLQ